MKAALYAVRQSQRWNWHLSLDLQVDLHYWSESTELEERTVMVSDSLLPLGRAVEWRHWLQRRRNGWFLPDGLSFRKMQATEQGSGLRGFFHHGNGPLREFARHLQGRALLPGEAADLLTQTGCKEGQTEWKKYVQAACLLGLAAFTGGLERDSRRTLPFLQTAYRYTCKRCGNDRRERFYQTMCASCGEICAYCEECLNMGKNRFCTPLIEGARQADRPNWGEDTEPLPDLRRWIAPREAAGLDRWGLSPAQREASQAGIAFLQGGADGKGPAAEGGSRRSSLAPKPDPRRFLLWAVTGAGKTEMVFPIIEWALERRMNVLVATPRKDVVLELAPRVSRAFPQHEPAVLYGGSGNRWAQGEITLATTHQLLRFRHRFDLVILDEIDAFPFHNNPMLEFAAAKACRPDGKFVLLTATPPAHAKRDMRRGRLPYAVVPARFHRHPLPVPRRIRTSRRSFRPAGAGSPEWMKPLRASLDRGAQIFAFASRIRDIDPLVRRLRTALDGALAAEAIQGTSSQDALREEKVRQFRERRIRLLVTTTILERGVTIAKADVFILQADSPLFDAAALVQMAGRSGRSAADPCGRVFFCAAEKTRSQRLAIREIRQMNRLARRKGFLNENA